MKQPNTKVNIKSGEATRIGVQILMLNDHLENELTSHWLYIARNQYL
jgi:hypothetical protein